MTMKFVLVPTAFILLCTSIVWSESETQQNDPLKITHQHWSLYVNEPIKHFRSAYQFFKENNYASSAIELRQSIAYLTLESLRQTPNKDSLIEIIDIVDQVAFQLEAGIPISDEEYGKTFTHVNFVLSMYYQDQAMRSWENERPVRAGRALNASIQHLERASKMSDVPLSDEGRSTVLESKQLSEELISEPDEMDSGAVKEKMRKLKGAVNNFKIRADEELKIERSF